MPMRVGGSIGSAATGICPGWNLKPRGEVEGTPTAHLTVDPESTAHELNQSLRDRQAEPSASVFAGGGPIDLGEWLQDEVLSFGGDPNTGIDDGHMQPNLLTGLAFDLDSDLDLASFGELDCVAYEVDEDLSQPARIADQSIG